MVQVTLGELGYFCSSPYIVDNNAPILTIFQTPRKCRIMPAHVLTVVVYADNGSTYI